MNDLTVIQNDNKIELKSDNINHIINQYYIYQKQKNICIGNIEYKGYHYEENIGDIDINIYAKYRQNGYAYRALKLLSEYLNQNEIPDFWATCNKNDLASLKIIIHHGELIEEKYISEEKLFFKCKTKQKNK